MSQFGFVPAGWTQPQAYYQSAIVQPQPANVPATPVEQPSTMSSGSESAQRNVLLLLHQKFPGILPLITLDELQLPSKENNNKPLFQCRVFVEDREFSGQGFSKKQAKSALATELLEYLQVTRPDVGSKFASTVGASQPTANKKRPANGQPVDDGSDQTQADSRSDAKRRKLLEKLDDSNFLQVFQEMCNAMGDTNKKLQLEYENCSPAGAKPNEIIFECRLTVGNKTFTAKGMGKKFLKQKTVKQAFKELFNIELDKDVKENPAKEILTILSTIGSQNIRQALQIYAIRHSMPFEVQETMSENNNPLIQMPSLAKTRSFTATCKFGEQNFEMNSSLSRRDCMDRLFTSIVCSVFNLDSDTIEKEGAKAVPRRRKNRLDDKLSESTGGPDKSPISLLYEMTAKNRLEVTFTEASEAEIANHLMYKPPPTVRDFAVKVTVQNDSAIGFGKSKKAAKLDATVQIMQLLSDYYSMNDPVNQLPDTVKESGSTLVKKEQFLARFAGGGDADQLHAASVTYYSRTKYAEVLKKKNGDVEASPAATFAAFLIRNANNAEFQVVSLAAGSKTSNTRSTTPGVNLRDCHGAVLARRGLLLYFYDQLGKLARSGPDQSIFEPVPVAKPDIATSRVQPKTTPDQQLYRLKSNYSVHLYDSGLSTPDASVANCLQCYQDDGVSTVPVPDAGNKRAIVTRSAYGQPSKPENKSMSLSDKLLKWNIVGLQGALLSLYLEPIYLESIVVDRKDCKTNVVENSVSGRFNPGWWASVKSSTRPDDPLVKYEPKRPKVLCFGQDCGELKDNNTDDQQGIKIPTDSALNWQKCCPAMELVAQDTGLDLQRNTSRLSKQSIFVQYTKLRQLLAVPTAPTAMYYDKSKQCAQTYAKAKMCFKNLLKINQLGNWPEKTNSVDHFTLPWLSD